MTDRKEPRYSVLSLWDGKHYVVDEDKSRGTPTTSVLNPDFKSRAAAEKACRRLNRAQGIVG